MIRRLCLVLAALSLFTGAVPSADATTKTGHVDAPMPFLFGPARDLYQVSTSLDQRIGDVVPLGTGLAHGSPFTVTPSAAGPVQVEIEFYTSLSGSGTCDPPAPGLTGGWTTGGGKVGTVDCDGDPAKYAVVILIYGADADFTLTY